MPSAQGSTRDWIRSNPGSMPTSTATRLGEFGRPRDCGIGPSSARTQSCAASRKAPTTVATWGRVPALA
jgi:hypothetical protein